MRSYQAARTYFSILEILSWCVIVAGGILAVIAVAALEEMSRGFGGPRVAGVAGIVPGLGLMFAGFMGLVLTQIGRAGVDSAEYSQQMLKIARDQLDVSRQALITPNTQANSFADAVRDIEDETSPFEKLNRPESGRAAATPSERQIAKPSPRKNDPAVEQGRKDGVLYFDGYKIEVRNGAYHLNGEVFDSLERARAVIPIMRK